MGFDVVYLPPIHPIGTHVPQGQEQHARRRRRPTSGARGRSEPPRAGTRTSTPSSGTIEDFDAFVAAAEQARARGRSRLRDPVLARPPVGQRAPGVVPPPARRLDPVRREPTEEVSGHLPDQLRHRGPRGAVERAEERARSLDLSRREDLPGRQPAHEVVPVLGMGHRRAQGRAPRPRSSLSEAFTRPKVMKQLAKLGFTQSLHVLHVAEHEVGARGVPDGAHPDGDGRLLPAELLRQHARTSFTSTSRRAGRPRSRSGSSWRRCCPRATAIYSGYELFENTPVKEGSEEYLDSEKYELKRPGLRPDRTPRSVHHPHQRDPHEAPGPVGADEPDFHDDRQGEPASRSPRRRAGADPILVIVNLNPFHWEEGTVTSTSRHLGIDPGRALRGARPDHRDPLTSGTARTTTFGSIPRTSPRTSSGSAASLTAEVAAVTEAAVHLAGDPHWYKTAVFYELYVRSFYDSNADGFGDFRGMIEKIDYLEWLGVDCIWLLPFYQSPLRDGGYDISDFYSILPEYGNLNDFMEFLDAAHDRGIRVVTDLVMNHTSDQHPWFQEARKPGSRQARLVRVVGRHREVLGRPDHLHRHREVELDVGRGSRRVLLAPVLQPPARPQLRQPRGPGADARRGAVLARPRARRVPTRRGSLSVRTRGHELREPARDARVPEARTERGRQELRRIGCFSRRRTSGPRTSSTTSERTATSATWRSTSR